MLAKFHQTAPYNEFYKHIGGDSQMMTAFNVSSELYVTYSLRADFTERDLSVLQILAPHLLNAFRNAHFIHRADESEMIGNALEQIGYGIITVDADLNVQNQNLAAVRMLREYFSLSFANGLPEKLNGYIKHCAAIFTGAEFYLSPAALIIKKLDARL